MHFNRAETMEKSKGGRNFFFAHMIDHHHHDHRISHFFENRNKSIFLRGEGIFQQDNAPVHKAKVAQDVLVKARSRDFHGRPIVRT